MVSGGTSANIAARYLHKDVITRMDTANGGIPPMASIEGLDLVTEGVITLGRALKLLKQYLNDEFNAEFFDELDANNGASRLAKLIIEECTELNMFVGNAMNEAYQDPELTFEISMRQNLVGQLKDVAEKMGKKVRVEYYD